MKKILIACMMTGLWLITGCHREGMDNNMNDAYEQPAKHPAPVTPDKTYEDHHYGTRNDAQSRSDSTANSKNYVDSFKPHR